MSDIERQNFLTQDWDAFPTISDKQRAELLLFQKQLLWGAEHRKILACGRVSSSSQNDKTLSIDYQQKTYIIHFEKEVLLGRKYPSLFQVLRSGDLVLLYLYEVNAKTDENSKTHIYCQNMEVDLLVPSFKKPSAQYTHFSIADSIKWQQFVAWVRQYFIDKSFIDLRTPSLVASPGLEAFLDPLKTEIQIGRNKIKKYLPTSPEFHLKKALCLGWQNIFELKDCYRDNERGPNHQIEFVMLEWYRSFSNLQAIQEDLIGLLQYLSAKMWPDSAPLEIKLSSVSDLFLEYCGFALQPETTRAELEVLCQHLAIPVSHDDSWDDIFFKIFLEKIEIHLGKSSPQIVYNYPPSQAALARINKSQWADRFELYWNGMELANAFHELNNANEQALRFREEQQKKQSLGKEVVDIDEEFMELLYYGLPPSGGIALGVDRLFMIFSGKKEIKQTRLFPLDL